MEIDRESAVRRLGGFEGKRSKQRKGKRIGEKDKVSTLGWTKRDRERIKKPDRVDETGQVEERER